MMMRPDQIRWRTSAILGEVWPVWVEAAALLTQGQE